MSNDFSKLPPNEQLKAENDFLKMKLMLENGARFNMMPGVNISPEIENDFLKYISEVEKHSANPKIMSIYEKIKTPFFENITNIPNSEIAKAWKTLSDYLEKFGLSVTVCSPNVSARELYRFVTEELFKLEIDDLDFPGMMTTFIYDEFHPDPVYDNTRLVEEDLLGDIFRKQQLFFQIHYAKEGFLFNGKSYKEWAGYFYKMERFKSLFEEISLTKTTVEACIVEESQCVVKGTYKALASTTENQTEFSGLYTVKLAKGYLDYWEFIDIHIEGFNPE